jgi:hypothetical protein
METYTQKKEIHQDHTQTVTGQTSVNYLEQFMIKKKEQSFSIRMKKDLGMLTLV